ncbi:uncharacterized protein LOC113321147 [Papaver somniferum]|uniref:uncharacterized protein LOC113321147 n=1 Tax=Papaver somniferum TaxID=3469 RepID=UPI000E705C44|nr:uncharacterized protein LOC113321147 [Papaver somniferum]
MEEEKKLDHGGSGGGGIGEIGGYWWWGLASAAQLAIGIRSYRRGYNGDGTLMPFKAFGVASIFLGSGAAAITGLLNLSGMHKVEDFKRLGANIRGGLGVPPRETQK